jgi:phosphoesterase RecJ-like protein
VNVPLAAKDVSAAVYMREVGENRYRVSLRSKNGIDVAKVAERYGGGGHKNAAGLSVEGSWDEKEEELVQALIAAVDEAAADES